jgi:Fic family protein
MKKAFYPNLLPVQLSSEEIIEIYKDEAEARARIEKFNSLLERSVIKDELLMLFSMDESIQSTRIEGTQATFSDVFEAKVSGQTNRDIQEVDNYFEAIHEGVGLLRSIPICTRMFLKLHELILRDSRGQNRSPGEYRKTQNFIGPTSRIEDASYIPPEPQFIHELMDNLEQYANNGFEDDLGPIARAAIIHAQFETIHPFLDGNGRLGRILIIFYLLSQRIISKPTFFMSEELEKNKFQYYARLNGVRSEDPKWKEWVLFFIQSAIKQADQYIEKLIAIESLYNELMEFAKGKRINVDVVNLVFRQPIFTVKTIEKNLGVSYNTAHRYAKVLLESGKIYADDKVRNRTYNFYDLIDVLR